MNWCDTQYHLIYHTKWHLYPDRSTEYQLLKCQGMFCLCMSMFSSFLYRGRHGRDRIVVEFTITYAMMLWVRIFIRTRCTTVCDKVCHWPATVLSFSPDPPVPSINKVDRHQANKLFSITTRFLPDLTMSNTTGFSYKTEIVYPSWAPEFNPGLLVESLLLIFLVFRVSGIQNWLYVWDLKAQFFNLRCSISWF